MLDKCSVGTLASLSDFWVRIKTIPLQEAVNRFVWQSGGVQLEPLATVVTGTAGFEAAAQTYCQEIKIHNQPLADAAQSAAVCAAVQSGSDTECAALMRHSWPRTV